jgi:hypothetical protein
MLRFLSSLGHKLLVNATVYIKNGSIFLLPLSLPTDRCCTAPHRWPRAMSLPHPSPRAPATTRAAVPRTPSWLRSPYQRSRRRRMCGAGCSGAQSAWPRRASRSVVVVGEEGSLARAGSAESSEMGWARSLTDDDLEELKGCVDLEFGFSYDEIPELCGTLPALKLCYSMSQCFQDKHQQQSKPEEPVTTNLKISSPAKLRLVRRLTKFLPSFTLNSLVLLQQH